MKTPISLALALCLATLGVALAAPTAEARPCLVGPTTDCVLQPTDGDVCTSYWFCVLKCAANWLDPQYCACAPECPPPPQDPVA